MGSERKKLIDKQREREREKSTGLVNFHSVIVKFFSGRV